MKDIAYIFSRSIVNEGAYRSFQPNAQRKTCRAMKQRKHATKAEEEHTLRENVELSVTLVVSIILVLVTLTEVREGVTNHPLPLPRRQARRTPLAGTISTKVKTEARKNVSYLLFQFLMILYFYSKKLV